MSSQVRKLVMRPLTSPVMGTERSLQTTTLLPTICLVPALVLWLLLSDAATPELGPQYSWRTVGNGHLCHAADWAHQPKCRDAYGICAVRASNIIATAPAPMVLRHDGTLRFDLHF